jgi:hypothetical protein
MLKIIKMKKSEELSRKERQFLFLMKIGQKQFEKDDKISN